MAKQQTEYSQAELLEVWRKATEIANVDPSNFRQDYAGAWIRFSDHGNRNSQYGWEVDHLKPVSKGGKDVMSNYLPLQWQNNVRKGDDYPRWATAVTADGQNNKEVDKFWKVNGE